MPVADGVDPGHNVPDAVGHRQVVGGCVGSLRPQKPIVVLVKLGVAGFRASAASNATAATMAPENVAATASQRPVSYVGSVENQAGCGRKLGGGVVQPAVESYILIQVPYIILYYLKVPSHRYKTCLLSLL